VCTSPLLASHGSIFGTIDSSQGQEWGEDHVGRQSTLPSFDSVTLRSAFLHSMYDGGARLLLSQHHALLSVHPSSGWLPRSVAGIQ
jgi:hypothetical protein